MNKPVILLLLALIARLGTAAQVLEDGEYFIKVNATGRYLAISGGNQDNNAQLVQWDFANQRNHKFQIRYHADAARGNYYTIRAQHSGRYLSTQGSTQRGSRIIQYDWVNQDNQRWILEKSGRGWKIICLDQLMRIYLSGFNAATHTPGNGSHFIINNDDPPMYFTFQKNEAAPPVIQTATAPKVFRGVKKRN